VKGPEYRMRVTRREAALLKILRAVRNGTIDHMSIQCGEPSVLKMTTQRIDFGDPDDIDQALGGRGSSVSALETGEKFP